MKTFPRSRCIYLDTLPVEKDEELMEDAKALFQNYGNNYEISFQLSIEFSNESFSKLYYTGKFPIFARHEEGVI